MKLYSSFGSERGFLPIPPTEPHPVPVKVGKRKSKRFLKKLTRTGSVKERKSYNKIMQKFAQDVHTAKHKRDDGTADKYDTGLIRLAENRVNRMIAKRKAIERLPVELRHAVQSFSGNEHLPAVPKRKPIPKHKA